MIRITTASYHPIRLTKSNYRLSRCPAAILYLDTKQYILSFLDIINSNVALDPPNETSRPTPGCRPLCAYYLFSTAHYLLNAFCFSHLYYLLHHLFYTYLSLFRPFEPSLLHKHLSCTYRAYLCLFSLIFTYFDQISKSDVR